MKKSFAKTLIIALICLFVCNILLSRFSGLSRSSCYFISILLYTTILFYNIVLQYKIQKILNEECDPYKYLVELKKFENYKRSKMHENYYALNYSAGLINQGKHGDAHEILKDINPSTLINRHKSAYYNNLMIIFLHSKQLDKAKELWNQLYIANASKKARDTVEYNLLVFDLMYFNPSDENRRLFIEKTKQMLSLNAKKLPMITKVAMQYSMGVAHFELGKIEQAKECFTYAIKNGNKLYIVELARQYLERINAL